MEHRSGAPLSGLYFRGLLTIVIVIHQNHILIIKAPTLASSAVWVFGALETRVFRGFWAGLQLQGLRVSRVLGKRGGAYGAVGKRRLVS